MLSKPHAEVAAAWAAYREPGTEKTWRWTVAEVRERFGYGKDAMYRDFDKCGFTERRADSHIRRKRKAQEPPCPAIGKYCVFCDLLPSCTDWHCQACDQTKTCACHLPKSQRWLGAWRAWSLERRQRRETLSEYEVREVDEESRQVRWMRRNNNHCKACGDSIADESVLCRTCRPKVSGLCARKDLSEEEAIEWVKEGYID